MNRMRSEWPTVLTGALIVLLSGVASADTPPDIVLNARVNFSTETALAESKFEIVADSNAPLGFNLLSSTVTLESPRVSLVPEHAKAEDLTVREARQREPLPVALRIRLPAEVDGFVVLDGMELYYGKRPDISGLFIDEPEESAGPHPRRIRINKRLTADKVANHEPDVSKRASDSEVLRVINALGTIRFCPEASQISIQSTFLDQGTGRDRPYLAQLVVSTQRIPCVDIDARLIRSIMGAKSAALITNYASFFPEYMSRHEFNLLRTAPHYACTGIYSYTSEVMSGGSSETFVSYNPNVGAKELSGVCGAINVTENERAASDARIEAVIKNENVFRFSQPDED